ncbi:hypothetical protein D3C81_1431310 [compost metagenome]
MLDDRGSVRQALGITVLGDHDHRVDGCRVQRRIGSEQVFRGLYAKVGGFLGGFLARQEGRTDLAENEILIFAEFRALGVVVHAFSRHVTGDAFYANHMASQFSNSEITTGPNGKTPGDTGASDP